MVQYPNVASLTRYKLLCLNGVDQSFFRYRCPILQWHTRNK